ncbi:MAG TPA: hypothetical protein VEP47_14695 [Reyranella sp.]|jgi:hypothetical protein|nr:hypothetical protein [Reyranella sp.]
MRFKWLAAFQDLFAAPPTAHDRPLRQILRFDIGVCPGCRQMRSVASMRCAYCGSTAPVAADA